MRHLLCLLVCVLLLVALAWRQAYVHASDDSYDLAGDIDKAWRAREMQFTTWDVTWKGAQFQTGALLLFRSRDKKKSQSDFPDVNIDYVRREVFGQPRGFRHEYRGQQWSFAKATLEPHWITTVFDGKSLKVHFPKTYTQPGFVSESKSLEGTFDRQSWPLLLFFRPVSELGLKPLSTITPSVMVKGVECSIIKAGSFVVWVEMSAERLPVKCCYYGGNSPTSPSITIDVSYEPVTGLGRMPSSWEISWFDPMGTLFESCSGKITKMEVNQPTPPSVFDYEFTTASWVENGITDESYIVTPGGGKRKVFAGEFKGNNYDEMLKYNPGSWVLSWWSAIVGCTVVVCLLLTTWFYKKRRRATAKT